MTARNQPENMTDEDFIGFINDQNKMLDELEIKLNEIEKLKQSWGVDKGTPERLGKLYGVTAQQEQAAKKMLIDLQDHIQINVDKSNNSGPPTNVDLPVNESEYSKSIRCKRIGQYI